MSTLQDTMRQGDLRKALHSETARVEELGKRVLSLERDLAAARR